MKKFYKASLLILIIFLSAKGNASTHTTTACVWNNNLFTSFWDTCTTTNKSVNAYASFNACWKYQWKINNVVVGTDRILHYSVQQNGTYNVCLSVIDTCAHCDTVVCSARVLTCSNTPSCNWANLFTSITDSCNSRVKAVYGYATQGSNCWKYIWKVNGNVVGTTRMLTYPVYNNGTYNVCLTISDTCAHCDTTICSARVFTCFNTTPVCNWANLFTSIWDSCNSRVRAVYGYATQGSNCWKYIWKVNGVIVGTTRMLSYPVPTGGPTYNVCLTITDTCTHCDTTICSARVLTCNTIPVCNWTNLNTSFWDTCTITKKSVNAYAAFNACWKYQWKVNNVVVGTDRILHYPVSQNGTYNVCLIVIDTCAHCDTTICSARVFTCFNTTPVCNWANLFTSIWDSCNSRVRAVYGYATQGSNCWKYIWKVNGVIVGTTRMLSYPVPTGGPTYNVCLTITDTCTHCDTTICSARVLTCNTIPVCNWTNNLYTAFWDSCTGTRRVLNAYASQNNCWKYVWKVNGVIVGTTRILTYPVPTGGPTYNVCLTITDTCAHCDTTICSARILTCNTTPVCNWQSHNPTVIFWDSCNARKKEVFGYIFFGNGNLSCYKFQWKVNNVNAGTGRTLEYPVTQSGTYNICVIVNDTCNHCDTMFCGTRVLTCIDPCSWSAHHPYVTFWDSCTGNKKGVYGYITFNSNTTCYKYQWTVNGQVVNTSPALTYPVTTNGTYVVCVKVTDTCNHCDTTICSTRVINCQQPCNWASRNVYVNFWDSCNTRKKTLNGYVYIPNNGCYKYLWKVNGVVVSTDHFLNNYAVNALGTYVVCVSVIDTCNHCDTTYCSTRVLNCTDFIPCTWATRYPYVTFFDTCTTTKKSLNGYITFNSSLYQCFKYQWKVNGQVVGTGQLLHYTVTANGTYNVCVTVTDTCNHCDTTFCSVRQLTCDIQNTPCNWRSRNPYVFFWDTCTTTRKSVNGYIAFNSNTTCFKYQWTVNGHAVGTGRTMTYPVTQNGTYVVCVSVIDTCNHCDTSFCSTRIINCSNTTSPCTWANRNPYTSFWDSCFGTGNQYSINGYIGFNSSLLDCFKYQWKANGVVIGTGRWISYPVHENGSYNLCVTVTDTCHHCDTTFCSARVITCVQLAGDPPIQLDIFPNPTRGFVNIFSSEIESTFTLTNYMGQTVKTGTLVQGYQQLDLSMLQSGTYVLRVETSGGVQKRKISLQN